MNLLNVIDQMEFKEYLIFISLFFAIVNFVAWIVLMKRQKLSRSLKAMAEKLVSNEKGFIDPIFFMACAAFISGLAFFYVEVPPKKEPECRTTTIIQYIDPETLKERPIEVKAPPKKQQKPCGVR